MDNSSQYFATIHTEVQEYMCNRGLQCFKLSGNRTERNGCWRGDDFLLFAGCLGVCSFFRICVWGVRWVLFRPGSFFLGGCRCGCGEAQSFVMVSDSLVPT